ncbi:hypothetical protein LX64_02419 [Chitinophaga skermanii]|uniref:Tetratricopeptide repeat protein n=1 Tax=Chitinophaga skermanii TaxID=331697 RepID=A0A327QNJ1_9BACT|nr:hypothetical protein [Chitinophaga skermanii]RAJ05264.1 hypothetical protein LX64_02419 [Chitinophaga skermanii]
MTANRIVQHIFKQDLQQVPLVELEQLVAAHPYFAAARLLLAHKIFAEEQNMHDTALKEAQLYSANTHHFYQFITKEEHEQDEDITVPLAQTTEELTPTPVEDTIPAIKIQTDDDEWDDEVDMPQSEVTFVKPEELIIPAFPQVTSNFHEEEDDDDDHPADLYIEDEVLVDVHASPEEKSVDWQEEDLDHFVIEDNDDEWEEPASLGLTANTHETDIADADVEKPLIAYAIHQEEVPAATQQVEEVQPLIVIADNDDEPEPAVMVAPLVAFAETDAEHIEEEKPSIEIADNDDVLEQPAAVAIPSEFNEADAEIEATEDDIVISPATNEPVETTLHEQESEQQVATNMEEQAAATTELPQEILAVGTHTDEITAGEPSTLQSNINGIFITEDGPIKIKPFEPEEITDDTLLFQPLYTEDYFAYKKLQNPAEAEMMNQLRQAEMKSFTDWLRKIKDDFSGKTSKDWYQQQLHRLYEDETPEVSERVEKMAIDSITLQDDIVTETLAEIWAAQKQYKKAILIYQKLSLLYPDKNLYFAQKIKELELQTRQL